MPSEWPSVSKGVICTGRVIVFDPALKFVKPAPVIDAFAHPGIPIHLDYLIGILLLICAILDALPPSSILAAILLAGYFGGAAMIHLGAGDPLFTQVLFPTCLGALLWWGLYIRALVSWRS